MEWEPEGCPLAAEQPHGYKHVHDEACGASPAQIEAQQRQLRHRRRLKDLYRVSRWEWPRIIWIEAGQWRHYGKDKLRWIWDDLRRRRTS